MSTIGCSTSWKERDCSKGSAAKAKELRRVSSLIVPS